MSELDNFLKIKIDQISRKFDSEKSILYKNYYNNFENDNLMEIFSIIHSNLNDLFTFMNSKNSNNGGHYNAHESRQLIELIEQIRIIKAKLTGDYSFEIDDYYSTVITLCKEFLSHSGGSQIPDQFQKINIIEEKPIFKKANSIEIKNENVNLYRSLDPIGGGSYATVFKYYEPNYDMNFALKRANKDLRPDELKRFENEFKDLKSLDSPFIIKAYTYNDEKNEYIMELANQDLHEFMRYNNNSLSFDARRALVIQLLKAFNYIHSKGLLHRDISYKNILIKKFEDENYLIKVADFGLVKRPDSSLTRKGESIKGAINDYSDLEIVGFENYEIRHETYALAKVIYFILTGRETNYHKEKNESLKNFIITAIGEKNNRFNNITEMKNALLKEVIPAVRKEMSM